MILIGNKTDKLTKKLETITKEYEAIE